MDTLDRNLEEVTDKALRTGEKIVSLQCPCCGRTFYATESEAAYERDNPADQSSTIKIKLGRKCPHCGFASGYVNNSIKEQQVEKMRVEMEAEQMAYEAAEKRQTPWSVVNNMGVRFEDPKDDK